MGGGAMGGPVGGAAPGGPMPVMGGGQAHGMDPNRRATGEEKQFFRQFYANAQAAVYDERSVNALANMVRAAQGQPAAMIEPLALAVSGAVGRVAYKGLEAGQPVTRESVVGALTLLSADIGQSIPQAVGLPPLDKETIHAVFLRAAEMLADQRDALLEGRQALTQAGPGSAPLPGGPARPSPGGGQPPRVGMAR